MSAEQFRPTFTTSVEAAEAAAEERGAVFHENVSVTEGTAQPSRVKSVVSRPMVPVKPPVMPVALSPRQKRLMHPK